MIMESNNYEGFIIQTVESMLPCFHDKNICLTMKIKMEWDDHGYDDSGSKKVRKERSFIKEKLLIFHRPSNYTLVLSKDVKRKDHIHLVGEELIMTQLSHHDSCWRSDGMSWVFKTFCESWDYFGQFGIEGRNIDPMFGYDIFGGSPRYHYIEDLKQDYCDDPNHRWIAPYKIKLGKVIEMHEISQYMPKPIPKKINKVGILCTNTSFSF